MISLLIETSSFLSLFDFEQNNRQPHHSTVVYFRLFPSRPTMMFARSILASVLSTTALVTFSAVSVSADSVTSFLRQKKSVLEDDGIIATDKVKV